MARVCINCGRHLNLLERGHLLRFAEACFCDTCFPEAEAFLIPVQQNAEIPLSAAADSFESSLQASYLNEVARSALRKEFEELAIEKFTGKTLVKCFDADFDTGYRAIQNACAEFSNTEPDAQVLELNGVKTAVFSVERYPIAVYHGFTLIVQLISCDGTNLVSTQISNRMYGDLRSAHRHFWRIFEEQNPDVYVKPVYE